MSWWCAATGAPWSWTWQAFPGIWIVIALLVGSYAWALRSLQPARFAADDQPVTRREIAQSPAGSIVMKEVTPLDISATRIRAQLQQGLSPRFLLPDSVLDYIERNRLYRGRL